MMSRMVVAKDLEGPVKPDLLYRAVIIPQVPGRGFVVQAPTFAIAEAVSECLALFQLHLFENSIVGDYSNAVFVEMWEDGEWTDAEELS